MFKQIVKQIREANQSADVFCTLDFTSLQQQLLSIVALIISRNQEYAREDTEIVKSAMDLWVVSIISNPQIKKDFYLWTRPRDEVVFI